MKNPSPPAEPGFDMLVDASGYSCPWPVLKLRQVLRDALPAGHVVKVIATDRGAIADFKTICGRTGNELMAFAAGKLEQVEARIADLEHARAALRSLVRQCDQGGPRSCAIIESFSSSVTGVRPRKGDGGPA